MGVRLNVIQGFLDSQQDLRAVARFAKAHDTGSVPHETGLYTEQIPLSQPGPGEQYAFQVDLDACTGCKACVAGCNKLNGLDADEAWRSVGLIHGGTAEQAIQQTVTTACHHCLDPACMNGCPVGAYEKDAKTGIVKHLDDQCIGCQYCTLTCPYEVPQYNKRLGIVRKCDMCSDRLAEGEAPACVQSCPNGAITIRIVHRDAVLEDAQGDAFLPGAPSPGITAPTTLYKTARALPRNVLPADFYSVRPAAQHMPLVIMLVLTQLSAGAFIVDALINYTSLATHTAALGRAHSLVALSLGLLAMGAATLHLGRPLYAFRAFIGLRRSWMSREIVIIGAFVNAAVVYALSFWLEYFTMVDIPELIGWSIPQVQRALGTATAALGALTVVCSSMIYVSTRREFWNGTITSLKFFGTAAVLGTATMTCTTLLAAYWAHSEVLLKAGLDLVSVLALVTFLKLSYEAGIFRHLWDKQQGELKRSAVLMSGPLKQVTRARYVVGALGGFVLPLLAQALPASTETLALLGTMLAATFLLLAGEFLERVLYFAAVSSARMPGGVGK